MSYSFSPFRLIHYYDSSYLIKQTGSNIFLDEIASITKYCSILISVHQVILPPHAVLFKYRESTVVLFTCHHNGINHESVQTLESNSIICFLDLVPCRQCLVRSLFFSLAYALIDLVIQLRNQKKRQKLVELFSSLLLQHPYYLQ